MATFKGDQVGFLENIPRDDRRPMSNEVSIGEDAEYQRSLRYLEVVKNQHSGTKMVEVVGWQEC